MNENVMWFLTWHIKMDKNSWSMHLCYLAHLIYEVLLTRDMMLQNFKTLNLI